MYLYDTGMIHSTIINSIILLLLSIIINTSHIEKPIKILLSFEPPEVDLNLEVIEQIPEIKISPINNITDEVSLDTESTSTELDINFNDFENIQLASSPMELPSLEELSEEINYDTTSESDEQQTSVKVKKSRDTKKVKNTSNVQNGPFGENLGFGENLINGGHNTEIANIQQRLEAAGAQTGDVQISIGWNSIDDIDLHVKYISSNGMGGTINWMNRIDFMGGCLDVDMNANLYRVTNTPVENIFWPTGSSPHGKFFIGIHNFRNWSGQPSVPVTIIVIVDGKKQVFNEICVAGQPLKEVANFVK